MKLSDTVRVRLTKHGKYIASQLKYEERPDGSSEWALFELFKFFGKHFGEESLFELDNIECAVATKFTVGQTVYFMKDNEISSATIGLINVKIREYHICEYFYRDRGDWINLDPRNIFDSVDELLQHIKGAFTESE